MSNTYGILLITVLMGNGLVGLPKRMWYYTDTERELNLLYMMVRESECFIVIAPVYAATHSQNVLTVSE